MASDVDGDVDGCLAAAAGPQQVGGSLGLFAGKTGEIPDISSICWLISSSSRRLPVDHLHPQMAQSTRKKGFLIITEYPGTLRIGGRVPGGSRFGGFRDLLVTRLTPKEQQLAASSPQANISPTRPVFRPGVLIKPVWCHSCPTRGTFRRSRK